MKYLAAIVTAALVVAASLSAAGDKPPRKPLYLNIRDITGKSASVQPREVTIIGHGPGWVHYQYPNGRECYYSGDYEIAW